MKRILFISLISLVLISCGGAKKQGEIATQDHLIMPTLFMQHAAEYKALCIQTYNMAYRAAEEFLQSGEEPGAIIMDLDETVLDNSPYAAWQIRNNQAYTPKTWKKWVQLAEADAVPGAVNFIQKVEALGFKVYFISNREVDELEATIKNLSRLQIPVLSPERYLLKERASEKESRRQMIRDKGLKFNMLIGDVLGDFAEAFDVGSNENRKMELDAIAEDLGRVYFLLPNTVYGQWENALYEYKNLEPVEKQKIRRNALLGENKFR